TFNGGIFGSGDAFVTKLNVSGSALTYSTYLGGASGPDEGIDIAVDSAGVAYVTGLASGDFPNTPGAFQTTAGFGPAFVTKLSASGSTLLYSTFLGGSDGQSTGLGIAVDSAGSVYVTGYSYATDFPTTPGAFDTSLGGTSDGFISKFDLFCSADASWT